ncbi:MAG: nucleoside hydrolase [Spirochaetales bacterium]|nr:nucleoside hydrolase [Spirochaetales bacterium]
MKKDIIIDCDPGQDDAIALMLAFAALDKINILGITTVAGNVQLKMTQRNARLICEKLGVYDISVFSGCEKPLFRNLVTAEEYHGENGLNGIDIFEPKIPLQDKNAIQFIIEELKKAESESISIIGIGPLTNIAMVLLQEPHLKKKIKEIIIMGGSYFEGGNVTAAAEFNFYVDPHAVQIVIDSDIPVTIFGLDATHQARVSKKIRHEIDDLPETVATDILKVSIDYFASAYKEIYGQSEPPIHDVLTIAYLIEPGLFEGRKCNVSIETTSELTMGASVVDYWNLTNKKKNVNWIDKVNSEGFFELLLNRIATLKEN